MAHAYLTGTPAIVALLISRTLYKSAPLYAKQTQFQEMSNERK